MNYAQIFSHYEAQLEAIGEEAESLTFTFRSLKNMSSTDFFLSLRQEVSEEDKILLAEIFKQLSQHIPAQYIIGEADFHGLTFKVDERVLIPRPETEELVDLILEENPKTKLSVLDIGTGSGAIAISLKHARPDWTVVASDISPDALTVAFENAYRHKTNVQFVQADVFRQVSGKYDIIVSNPPYISKEDRSEVGINVINSEPHLALFAEEDGFAIYRKIIEGASEYLTEQGKLYFEIGYKQGPIIQQVLTKYFPKKRIRILKDIFGKDRKVVVDNG
ncbi:peptide chain release factor N(5)-glutamine methyltransferase [Streptococcus minor]|uniref:Release factor glutamine methyltransferase n=1 Tax=Streptococcus minor TaxID=229549 RepID=A0A3P1VFE8_9STRE|nr:peptide chain release factor N(5)-glutamine methyltransferase [Streptococcus minor]RRD32376.1 peptide chain release factor N(5)-glutamine methyltransferase [Streptococcus minor]